MSIHKHNLSPALYFSLLIIADHDGITTTEISEIMDRNLRNVQRRCKQLEEMGLVVRKGNSLHYQPIQIKKGWERLTPHIKPLRKDKQRKLDEIMQSDPSEIDWDKVDAAEHPIHFLISECPRVEVKAVSISSIAGDINERVR